MRYNRILSVFAVILLIVSGISVIMHSTDAEPKQIDGEQDEKPKKKMDEDTKKDEISKGSESNDLNGKEKRDLDENFKSKKSQSEIQNSKEEQEVNNYKKIKDEEKSNLIDDTKAMDDFNGDTVKDSKEHTSVENRPIKHTSSGNDIGLMATDYDHELIFDTYEITFEDNLTALAFDANFSIYRIEIEIGGQKDIYTAQQIRENDTSGDLIDPIKENMTTTFKNTIYSAFPDADITFDEATVDKGTSGPINVSNSANVYLTKTSLGFDEQNDDLNISEVIRGSMKMGAHIMKGADLTVEPGHNSTYRFEVPLPYLMESMDTWGVWGGDNNTFDDGKERVSTWIFNNSAGNDTVVLDRVLEMSHEDPVDVSQEKMETTGLFDMKSFETVNINNTVSVFSVNIASYEDIIPSSVSNLNIITADGIRLFLNNSLMNKTQIKEESLDNSINNIEASIQDLFGEEPEMEFVWNESSTEGYDVEEMSEEPALQCYITTTDSVGFTSEKLGMPAEASINEVVNETLKLDATINFDFNFLVEDGMYYILKIDAPENVEIGEEGSGRYDDVYEKEIDNTEGDNPAPYISLNMRWSGDVRTYQEEDVDADMLMNMNTFKDIPIDISMRIYSVNLNRYGDDFNIPGPVNDLDYIDGNYIRMSVRNDLVDLTTIRKETVKPARENVTEGLGDLFGQSVEMDFSWESTHWKNWSPSEWEEQSSQLVDKPFSGELYTPDNNPAGFDPSGLDLPAKADIGEIVRSILELDATIRKDFTVDIPNYIDTKANVSAPEDIKFVDGRKENGRWWKTYQFEGTSNEATLVWEYDGEVREVTQEDISIEGVFELQNLESIDLTLNASISSVDTGRYDGFSIPDPVENLDYVDAQFIRTAINNDLAKWKDITDEMNSSVEDVENKIPSFLGDVDFTYKDPGRTSGTIIRRYEVKNFQPNITADDEDVELDNELTESLMNSGAIVDFEFPSMDQEYEDYSTRLELHTPDFIKLYDSNGNEPKADGEDYYEINPQDGFNGTLRSALDDEELPNQQSIGLDMKIDLESISIKTQILNMDYKADANAIVDAKVEAGVVEAPQDMKDSLPNEIKLEYATADLIRQAEKRDIFDKQRILDMTRDGEDMKDFDGMNQTLRDALGKDDIGVNSRFKDGTWETGEGDGDSQPIVLLIDSEFSVPVKESSNGNAFDIYGIDMGELEIPSSQGIDTEFRIIFPSGIRPSVEETDNVKTGENSDSRNYIEVQRSGDSEEPITMNPEIVITSGILFSGDVYLHGIPLMIITILIIALIVIGIGIKVAPYKNIKKKKIIRQGMEDALVEENDPDLWLAYIPEEKKEKHDITQNSVEELGLEEELKEMREEAEKERAAPPTEESLESTERENVEEGQWIDEKEESIEDVEEESAGMPEESEVEERSVEKETTEGTEENADDEDESEGGDMPQFAF